MAISSNPSGPLAPKTVPKLKVPPPAPKPAPHIAVGAISLKGPSSCIQSGSSASGSIVVTDVATSCVTSTSAVSANDAKPLVKPVIVAALPTISIAAQPAIRIPELPTVRIVTLPTINTVTPALAKYSPDNLFAAMWRSIDCIHQLGALDRKTKKFRNYHVNSIAVAVSRALALSAEGIDAYIALAGFKNAFSRCVDNALGAWGFWLDIDCGKNKADSGKGYKNIEVALQKLGKFCKDTGLPMPTHFVDSGGGLHVYWVLDKFVDRETWQKYALKLKVLTKALGFLADDSRTSDIASVLRAPGTLNFKYDPPRPVVLLQASNTFIEQTGFFAVIDTAHDKLCPVAAAKAFSPANNQTYSSDGNSEPYPTDLEKLASALATLDPDCDDKTWKFHRIAPIARAAYLYPDKSDALYQLARSWSSGKLSGTQSKAWVTPGESNGLTGEQVFDSVWQRFFNDKDIKKPTSIRTIYFHAREAGWVYTRNGVSTGCSNDADEFEQCATTVVPLVQQSPTVAKPAPVVQGTTVNAAVAPVATTTDATKEATTKATDNTSGAATSKGDAAKAKEEAKEKARAYASVALSGIQQQFGIINIGGKLTSFDLNSLTARTSQGTAQRLMLSNRSDGTLLVTRAVRSKFPRACADDIADEFWVNPNTICYDGVEFNPIGTSGNFLNLWLGPTIIPKAGGWVLIKAFLFEVICAGDRVCYLYLIAYIAHALQRPEEKPGVMIILIGGQGIGKGTVARILRKIWGMTYLQISNVDSVTGNFNASLERAYIVFMDEALFAGDHKAANNLKSLVTEPVIHINEKYQPSRQTNSFHRFFAATNADHLKNTDRDDRRDLVLRVSEARKGDFAYWLALNHEIDNGGVEAMVHDLLAMDLSGFNVRAKPDTKELLEQKLQSLGPIPRWWHDCLSSGELSVDGDWPAFISTADCIKDIWEMTGGKSFKKPAAIDVVQALLKLCPSAISKQQNDSMGVRKRGLALPSLDQARAEFDKYIGGSVNWPVMNSGDISEVSSGDTTEAF